MLFGQRLRGSLGSRWLVLVNVLLAVAAVAANHYFQFFCRPVMWASIALVISFVPVVFFNLIGSRITKCANLVSFLFGLAACICVYCMLFLWEWNLLAFPMALGIPVAILAYVPHFFLLQVLARVFSASGGLHRRSFFSAVGTAIAFVIVMAVWFNANVKAVSYAIRCDPDAASAIKPSYMTERMLGVSWKYHLSFCAYDGWRPPLHDPALVSALWLNVLVEPALFTGYEPPCEGEPWPGFVFSDESQRFALERAIIIYQRVFPGRPIREDCSCAVEESSTYLNDPLWQRRSSRER